MRDLLVRLSLVRKLSSFCPARTQGDAIGARRCLQRRQRDIRIDVRQVGHALLFDQMACARQHLHQPRDDLVEQARELSTAVGACASSKMGSPSVRRYTPRAPGSAGGH